MKKSTVYFTDFHIHHSESLPKKLQRLMKSAGFETLNFEDRYAAIKIHFGELGNMAYLRPQYAKAVADYVKELGGKPFLTDCNTLYVGTRKNALDHLDTAYLNGFSPLQTGCHVIIGDGLKGSDEALVPVDLPYVKEAKIGQAIMDADIVISLTHFKGHEEAGFGGALKNLGMGCGSRAGKMEQHYEGKPVVEQEMCVGCGACARICAHGAPILENGRMHIDHNKCVGCGRCISACPQDAVEPSVSNSTAILACKIAEYTYAVVKDRPAFHISLICDVSPDCDCYGCNDVPIIPDVGMLASFDPVALDQACVDLCNKMPVTPGSRLDRHFHEYGGTDSNHEYFHMNHPDVDWEAGLIHAEKIGLGSREYELVMI